MDALFYRLPFPVHRNRVGHDNDFVGSGDGFLVQHLPYQITQHPRVEAARFLWRDADCKAATLKALGERFLDEYVPTHCKLSMAYEYRRSVELFIDSRDRRPEGE